MTMARKWSVGTALVAVVLLVASWFLLISPQRSEAASLRQQNTEQKAFNDKVRLDTQQLKAQFASLPARQAQLAEIKQQLPDTPALPSLVRDLSSYADDAGAKLVSVAPAAPGPLDASAGSTTATTTTTATQSAPIQQIQTTVVATGTYADLTLYLQKLQSKMRRALLVENLVIEDSTDPDAAPSELKMTIIGKVFVLDTRAATQAAAAAAKSGATPSTSSAK